MNSKILIKDKIHSFNKKISVSGDKSISIRSVLLASQAVGTSKIYNLLESEDVLNSLKCIKRLGINYKKFHSHYKFYGYGLKGYNTKKNIVLDAGNSGTLARLILGILVDSQKTIKIVGDKSLSKRDFSRITEPLKMFGANIVSKKKKLPVLISGSAFLRPIIYEEKLGSAQCKSAVMLAALKAPGITKIKAKKSRNHTEIFFKNLNIPIKVINKKKYDLIEVKGHSNFNGFNYNVPGDISSCSFFSPNDSIERLKTNNKNVNINDTRTGVIKILKKMNAYILYKNKKNYKGEEIADIYVESTKI